MWHSAPMRRVIFWITFPPVSGRKKMISFHNPDYQVIFCSTTTIKFKTVYLKWKRTDAKTLILRRCLLLCSCELVACSRIVKYLNCNIDTSMPVKWYILTFFIVLSFLAVGHINFFLSLDCFFSSVSSLASSLPLWFTTNHHFAITLHREPLG